MTFISIYVCPGTELGFSESHIISHGTLSNLNSNSDWFR